MQRGKNGCKNWSYQKRGAKNCLFQVVLDQLTNKGKGKRLIGLDMTLTFDL